MPIERYTRKQASIQAYLEVTGEWLPLDTTFEMIKKYVAAFPEDLREQCRLRYRQYMLIGRPNREPVPDNDFEN